jgi:hypothetical protein
MGKKSLLSEKFMRDNCFEWYSSECSPLGFPTEILEGYFVLNNGIKHQILTNQFNNNGWGNLGSDFFLGSDLKPVPAYLNITYISFIENKVYSGEFFFEKESLISTFKMDLLSPINGNNRISFNRILIGLAPVGSITVWLFGDSICKEVAHFKCEQIVDFDIRDYYRSYQDLQEYSEHLQKEKNPLSRTFKNAQNNSLLSRWTDLYRTVIKSQITIQLLGELRSYQIWFYNGESSYQFPALKNTGYPINRIPKKIKVDWLDDQGEPHINFYTFNEDQIFNLFEEFYVLKSSEFRFIIQLREHDNSIRVWMISGESKYQIL